MMVLAGFLAASLSLVPVPELAEMTEEIDALVLAGKAVPPDFLLRVRRMASPEERMQIVVYLRRSGLLTGPALDLHRYVFNAESGTSQTDRNMNDTASAQVSAEK
ncbi:hypothetical protein [Paracoccus aerodenitrificans]|uniref:hypothetical protein n=1 Tax=Paracoccus aerodenitrificans TaxID=3017781 RepID=UPI0022F119C3|nr:hypothetical protein [Paracoccus aerodenitrificans]WBU63958.1 hypothetical protein PAE61_16760 [Paracoccus aerodenitrificans]